MTYQLLIYQLDVPTRYPPFLPVWLQAVLVTNNELLDAESETLQLKQYTTIMCCNVSGPCTLKIFSRNSSYNTVLIGYPDLKYSYPISFLTFTRLKNIILSSITTVNEYNLHFQVTILEWLWQWPSTDEFWWRQFNSNKFSTVF